MQVHTIYSFHGRVIKACYCPMVFCLLLLPFSVQADKPSTVNPQIARMQAQINALTKRLDQLEGKVQLKHSPDTDSDLAHRAQSGLAALHEIEKMKAGWKKLQRGLSATQLLQLLGNPDSKTRVNNQVLWYYIYPSIGRGSVMFDYNGKISAWQKPPF